MLHSQNGILREGKNLLKNADQRSFVRMHSPLYNTLGEWQLVHPLSPGALHVAQSE